MSRSNTNTNLGIPRLWPMSRLPVHSSFALLLFCSMMLFSFLYLAAHPTLANGDRDSFVGEPKRDNSPRKRSLRMNPYINRGMDDSVFLQSPFFDEGPFYFQKHLRSTSMIPTFTHTSNSFMDSIFSSLLPPPGYEITELDKNKYQIQMFIPGTKASDISIELMDNARVLRITGSRTAETRGGGMVTESHFEKRFYVDGVDSAKITAKLEDGLLTVVVPKKDEPTAKPDVKIPVSTIGKGPLPEGTGILEQL